MVQNAGLGHGIETRIEGQRVAGGWQQGNRPSDASGDSLLNQRTDRFDAADLCLRDVCRESTNALACTGAYV